MNGDDLDPCVALGQIPGVNAENASIYLFIFFSKIGVLRHLCLGRCVHFFKGIVYHIQIFIYYDQDNFFFFNINKHTF